MYLVDFEGQLPIHGCMGIKPRHKCQMLAVYANYRKSRGLNLGR